VCVISNLWQSGQVGCSGFELTKLEKYPNNPTRVNNHQEYSFRQSPSGHLLPTVAKEYGKMLSLQPILNKEYG